MGTAFRVETIIDRPPKTVWAVLTDWSNANRWMAGIDFGPQNAESRVGSKLTFRARGKDQESEIVALDPCRRVILRSVQGSVSADYEYLLEPLTDDRTKLTLTAHCSTEGLIWRLVSPLLHLAMRLTDGGQPEALKRVAESAPE